MRQALAIAKDHMLSERQLVCLARLLELAVEQGKIEQAHQLAAELEQAEHGRTGPGLRAMCRLAVAKLHLRVGEVSEAIAKLEEAYSVFSQMRICDDLLDSAYQLARAYSATGQQAFAAYYLRVALDMIEQVVNHLTDDRSRRVFLNDPRRQALFGFLGRRQKSRPALVRASRFL